MNSVQQMGWVAYESSSQRVELTKTQQVLTMYCQCGWMQFLQLCRAQLPTKATDEVPKQMEQRCCSSAALATAQKGR